MNMITSAAEAAVPPLGILHFVKVVVATIVVVLMLALAGISWYLFGELKEANKTNGQLKTANAALQQDLALIKVGQAAMGLGQLISDQQKQELDKKTRDTRDKLKQKEQAIDKSTVSPEEKARQKSEARMSSIWDMYCQIQPTNAICTAQATPAVAAPPGQTQTQEQKK